MSDATDETATTEVSAPAESLERQWPFVLELKYPVQLSEKTPLITSITFRRPKIGDMRGIKLSEEIPTDHLILIASRLSGQLPKVIELLDADDGQEVMGIALDFFVKCLANGRRR